MNENSTDKLKELIQQAENLPNNGFLNTFREIKERAEIILKNELGADSIHLLKLKTVSYKRNYPGKKLKAILRVALEEIKYLDIEKSKTEKKTEEIVKTYCYNCQKDTNQRILFNDFEVVPQEILWRNDEGDQGPSMWTNVGNIWLLSKCMGCEKINFKFILRSSPDKTTDRIFHYPLKLIREVPCWIMNLPKKYLEIAQEVYASVNNELFILALNGIRTLLDVFVVEKVGDVGDFKQKMKKLVCDGIITSTKAKVLEAAIDAGNASSHRGYKPEKEILFKILDIVENLLHSEIIDRQVDTIKQKTPIRRKPKT